MPPRRSRRWRCRSSSASSPPIGRPTSSSTTPASAEARGLQVLIAGAGGAAHLRAWRPRRRRCRCSACPIETKTLKGMDSLLSIVQMPAGVPVGTLAIGRAGAVNAALLAAAILARGDEGIRERLAAYRAEQTRSVLDDPIRRRDRTSLTLVACIGGGQLGRMLGLAGLPLGLDFRFLDPSPAAPAADVGELVVGAFDDPAALARLAAGADVVTYEFENVSVEAARALAPLPPPRALELGQDRLVEKQLFERLGIPTARFGSARPRRGSRRSSSPGGSGTTGRASGGSTPRSRSASDELAEELVAFERELSIIARPRARRRDALLAARRRTSIATASSASRGRRPPARRKPRPRSSRDGCSTSSSYVGVLALELFEVERRAARERVRSARPQHGPLDDRRRRHEPVREPPAGDPRPPARVDRRDRRRR